jgi:non-ribosomal peptide synthase protein (TIGR01720 family)
MKRSANRDWAITNRRSLQFTLTEKETALLRSEVNEALNTETNDILLTALALSVNKYFGEDKSLIALESIPFTSAQDTEVPCESIDPFYPVVLDSSYHPDLGRQVKEVKETLRRVPSNGTGYGVLKHLLRGSVDERVIFKFRPQIHFTYRPQQDILPFRSLSPHIQSGLVEFDLSLSASIKGKAMQFELIFNTDAFTYKTITDFSACYQEEIIKLISYCTSVHKNDRSPSDFTYKGLSIEELEDLLK